MRAAHDEPLPSCKEQEVSSKLYCFQDPLDCILEGAVAVAWVQAINAVCMYIQTCAVIMCIMQHML